MVEIFEVNFSIFRFSESFHAITVDMFVPPKAPSAQKVFYLASRCIRPNPA